MAATLVQMGISRTREFQADESGAVIAGKPLALASALEKIELLTRRQMLPDATPATSHLFIINPFSGTGDWLMSLFLTHPPTAQRVARLRELAKRS